MTFAYWMTDEAALDFLREQHDAEQERYEARLDEQGQHLPLAQFASPHVALVEKFGMDPRDPDRYVAPLEEAA